MRLDVRISYVALKVKMKPKTFTKNICDRTLGSQWWRKRHLANRQLLSIVVSLNLHYVKIMSGKCSNKMANNNRVESNSIMGNMVGNIHFDLTHWSLNPNMISNRTSIRGLLHWKNIIFDVHTLHHIECGGNVVIFTTWRRD